MYEVARIIQSVIDTQGNIAKASILRRHSNNDLLKSILKFIYDPYNKCCIGHNKLNKFNWVSANNDFTDPLQVIKYLTRNNTGSDNSVHAAATFVKYHEGTEAEFLAKAIVLQDLKMGVALKTLNEIFGSDFIPTVGCMLGTDYGKVKNVSWPCIETEKLDGIRRILVKREGVVRMFSRSGHEDIGCVEIIEEALKKDFPNNTVYDGELMAIGNFKDNIAIRQASSSIANSKGEKRGISFNIFDMIPCDEFFAGKSKEKALARKIRLAALFGDEGLKHLTPDWQVTIAAFKLNFTPKFLKAVPILGVASCIEETTDIVEKIWKAKGEGIMLNTFNGYYEIKRSKNLLKIKYSEDMVLQVVNVLEGSEGGKNEDSLGALVVIYKGYYVGVGSGLSDELRKKIWNNPMNYIGKYIEVETFGESTNASGGISLNCPIFKRFVGEE